MATLTESSIRGIVRDELRDVKHEVERLRSSLAVSEQKLNELHSIQAGIARMAPEIQQLVVMAKLLPDERRALGRIQSGLEDIRSRLNSIERSVAYASSYAAIRLKERSDAQG